MMTYKIFIFLNVCILSNLCNACKAPIKENYSFSDEKHPTIFIGKTTERKLFKNTQDGFSKIELKFIPLKMIKGKMSIKEYFWFPTNTENLTFVVGDSALIFANKNNKIKFGHGDWCHGLSRSLGNMSLKEIDEILEN